jgi:hypothetical protein
MGSGEGEVTFADAMALLVRRIRTAPTQPPIKCQKKSPRRQARPKSGLRGCVGSDPTLVPDAASLLVEWAHQQNLSGVPKRVRV